MLEQWLLANALPLIGAAIVLMVAYSKFKAKCDETTDTRELLDVHIKSMNPHTECAVHGQILQEIRDKLATIDERVYAIYRSNGFSKKKEE